MKAIVLKQGELKVEEVNKPQAAAPGHIVVEMIAAAINNGDKFFLYRPALPGTAKSLYDIRGVSGVGTIIETGEGVPANLKGRNVTIYRQLQYSETVVGTWSEYAHVPYLDCAVLPGNVDAEEYAGSMVNIITPYAFMQQAKQEGHKGMVSTAGNSATGIALLGFCLAQNIPLVSIVRNEQGRQELEALGAKNIVVQSADDFNDQLSTITAVNSATAIFDGVGGQLINKIVGALPFGAVIYSYGYLGDSEPLTVPMSLLGVRNLTLKPFLNIFSETVRNPDLLAKALEDIAMVIHLPHFKTKLGERFTFEAINDALQYKGANGQKAVLVK